jgi:hypothetical protein
MLRGPRAVVWKFELPRLNLTLASLNQIVVWLSKELRPIFREHPPAEDAYCLFQISHEDNEKVNKESASTKPFCLIFLQREQDADGLNPAPRSCLCMGDVENHELRC